MQSEYFDVWIPVLPPGINQTYKTTKIGGFYKSEIATEWQEKSALIIGSKAAELDFEPYGNYSIYVEIHNSKADVDASIKLIIDTITQKLGFDDKHIIMQSSIKIQDGIKGIKVSLTKNK